MNLKEKIQQNRSKFVLWGAVLALLVCGFILTRFSGRPVVSAAPSAINNTPVKTFNQHTAPQATNQAACPIKAKQSKTGKKLYYLPDSLFYKKLKNPVCFDNEPQALGAGYAKSAH